MGDARRLASRGVDRASRPGKFRPGGPLQILRQQESAVGCLFWLVTFTPCLSACRAATLRFGCSKRERTDTYATPLPIQFIFAFLFAKQASLSRRNCLHCLPFFPPFFPLSLIIIERRNRGSFLDFSDERTLASICTTFEFPCENLYSRIRTR